MILKKILFILVATALVLPVTLAYADTPCKKREAAIEAQLADAKANKLPVAGLEEALANHRKTCNDADLLAKMRLRVEERKLKVSKAELELKSAQASGDAVKITDKGAKLQKAKDQLTEAEAELAELQ